jgi:hypothetical protein
MELVWVDTDDRAILFLEFSDFPDVLALKDDVIVEFVCKGQSCKFRAREMEDRRKKKAVDDALQSVEYGRYYEPDKQRL